MKYIPIKPIPHQSVRFATESQNFVVKVKYCGEYGIYCDVTLNGDPIILNRLAKNKVNLIPLFNNGAQSYLAFVDSMGDSDPDYTKFGDRFFLCLFDNGESSGILR